MFTDEFINGNPNIFTNSQYHLWYKYLRGQFSPVLINNKHYNVSFFIKLKGKFLKYEQLIKTIDLPDLCYQYYIDGPYFLFGELGIRDRTYEPFSLQKQINFM